MKYVVYNSKFIAEVESNGVKLNLILLELAADSVDDFPAADAEEGQLICFGSIGYEINTGKIYVLNSEGEWKDSGGEANAQSGAKSLTLSNPSPQKGDKIEIEQPEEKEFEILDIEDIEEKGVENDDEPLPDTKSK